MNQRSPGTNPRTLAAIATMVALFAYASVLAVQQAAQNQVQQDFNASGASLATLTRMFMIGFFAASVLGGRLSDRYGKLQMVSVGGILMAAGMAIFFCTRWFAVLPYALLIAGVGGGFSEVVSMAAFADLYEGSRRTIMMNWAQVVFAAGAVAMPLLFAGMLSAGIAWRWGYLAAAGLSVLGAVASLAAGGALRQHAPSPEMAAGDWRAIVVNRTALRLGAALFLYVGGELGLGTWIAIYMLRDLHASPAIASASVAALWIGIGLGRVITTRIVGMCSDDTLIRWSLALGSVAVAVLLRVHSPTLALVVTFLAGLPMGPAWPTIVSRTGQEFPQQSGTAIGIVAAMGCWGAVTIPPTIGWLSDRVGMRAALWMSVAALMLAVVITSVKTARGRDNHR